MSRPTSGAVHLDLRLGPQGARIVTDKVPTPEEAAKALHKSECVHMVAEECQAQIMLFMVSLTQQREALPEGHVCHCSPTCHRFRPHD